MIQNFRIVLIELYLSIDFHIFASCEICWQQKFWWLLTTFFPSEKQYRINEKQYRMEKRTRWHELNILKSKKLMAHEATATFCRAGFFEAFLRVECLSVVDLRLLMERKLWRKNFLTRKTLNIMLFIMNQELCTLTFSF